MLKRNPEVIDLKDPATKDLAGYKYVAKKVVYFVVKYLLVAPVLLSLSFVFNAVTIVPKLYNYLSVKALKEKVEDHKREVLKTALDVKIQEKTIEEWEPDDLIAMMKDQYEEIPRREISKFVRAVKRIEQDVRLGRDTSEIRVSIDKLMSSDIYQALKETDHPAIEFLQILCMKYIGGKGEGQRDIFEEYGREIVGDQKGQSEFTLGELADIMDQYTGAGIFRAYQRNGVASTIVWAISHPFDYLHSTIDEWDSVKFNSHEGNPDVYGYDFTLPENDGASQKHIRFYYGPGPTGDRLYNDGYLVYMDKKGLFERRTNHQNIHHRSEALRIYEMRRYEEAHPESLRFLSLSFDTPFMKNPPRLCQDKPVQNFMRTLKKHYCEEEDAHRVMHADQEVENGVYIGSATLEDDGVELALETSKDIFSTLSQDNDYWDGLMGQGAAGEKRLVRMMILGTHAMIGVGSLYKALQDAPVMPMLDQKLDADLETCRASGACKQDIDRAVVENVTERIFFRLLTNDGPITKQELDSIVGAVLARAYLVEGRLIQWKRYEILSDLLHFIGTPENTKKLSACLKSYIYQMDLRREG